MNIKELRGVMHQKNISIRTLANALGLNASTVYRKIQQNGDTFTLDELEKMVDYLGLNSDQRDNIFFGEKLADTRELNGVSANHTA